MYDVGRFSYFASIYLSFFIFNN